MKRLYLKLIFLLMLTFLFMKPSIMYAQCVSNDTAGEFVTNTIVTGDNEVFGDWVIDSTVTVKIYGTVKFRQHGKLIIKRGAKVELYGATITQKCSGKLWDGIYIQGNLSRNQWTSSNYDRGQGILIADSNSTIEWSEHGIVADGGAVVQISSTSFHNNYEGVAFKPYLTPSDPTANISYIDNCDFLCDDSIPSHKFLDYFIKVQGVRGIFLSGNHFTNSTPKIKVIERGVGIESVDANITVCAGKPIALNGSGCISTGGRRSYFTGLSEGIENLSVSTLNKLRVFSTDFLNTQYFAVSCGGSIGPVIKLCSISYDSNLIAIGSTYGIKFYGVCDFDIDSNKFIYDTIGWRKSGSKTFYYIYVYNSGNIGGRIYNNLFTGISPVNAQGIKTIHQIFDYAIYTVFNNPKLVISCNAFRDNSIDMAFYKPTGVPFDITVGDFGSQTLGSGNSFNFCGKFNTIQIPDEIKYYDDSGSGSKHLQCQLNHITVIEADNANPCTPVDCLK